MRESFGGAFMIKLAIIFIVIYVSFMAVAINYAKAFRIKNRLIDYVEQSQFTHGDNTNTLDEINDYLGSMAYHIPDEANELENDCLANEDADFLENGACIVQHCDDNENCYYKVTTYISIAFPFFKLNMTLPVSGETKTYSKRVMERSEP